MALTGTFGEPGEAVRCMALPSGPSAVPVVAERRP